MVTFAQEPYNPRKHDPVNNRWGREDRPWFIDRKVKNYILTALTITLNGKQLIIPPEHLSGLFNPKFYYLAIIRDREKRTISLGIEGGHTPNVYGVDFYFADGKYLKRSFGYTGEVDGRLQDLGLEELYHGK